MHSSVQLHSGMKIEKGFNLYPLGTFLTFCYMSIVFWVAITSNYLYCILLILCVGTAAYTLSERHVITEYKFFV